MNKQIGEEQTIRDRCNLRTIYDIFDNLSPKGKGVCIENLVRKITKEEE